MLTKFLRLAAPATLIATVVLAFSVMPAAKQTYAATPSISVSPATAPQGGTITVNGSGFTANDSILTYVDTVVNGHTQRAQASGTSDGSGSFSLKVTLPRSATPNTYTVVAQDTHSLSASQKINVLALIVLKAGTSGAKVSVLDRTSFFIWVTGMKAGETVKIQASFPVYGGNSIVETRTPAANAQGNVFGVTMFAPRGAKAAAAGITAVGQSSNRKASGQVSVFYRPSIAIAKSVAPGENLTVKGTGFVSNAQVKLQATVKANDGSTPTLTAMATADNNGNFTQPFHIPGYVVSGTYVVTAIDQSGGFRASAKAVVSQFHASLSLLPNVTLPNEFVTVAGTGFPANSAVTVSSTVNLRNGATRAIAVSATTDSGGAFARDILIPYKTSPGTYTVTATASSASASADVQVLPLSAHPANLSFRWVSLWYHVVRQGTWDVIVLQASLHTTLGIWAHVIFPNGLHHDYYTGTKSNGQWTVKFSIPRHSVSRHSNQAFITLQLWHGEQTAQKFMTFTLV